MITCKQVSKALESQNYEDLSPLKKLLLRLHISLCVVCGKYNRQMVDMHILTRKFFTRECSDSTCCLSDKKKAEIRQALVSAESE